ncbi:MAG: hypothetical protein KGH61_02330 [Candidatus Micrarchaeota archaeon]|nr:hypothetical protein [Candidatus Micrarchaeota archaeon]MDE1847765.1 hypothetical protein [Candidatus Micrarchaeota archaeon]MDE1863908.1 hypothetical protein [Candidatus Micrarchaeota archaeon]
MEFATYDYNRAVDEVSRIDEGFAGPGEITISPKEAFAQSQSEGSYDYEDACTIIVAAEAQMLSEQQVAQQQQRSGSFGAVPIVPAREVIDTAARIKSRIGKVEISKRLLELDKKALGAAASIRGIVEGAGRELGGAGKSLEGKMEEGIARARSRKLVLPTLSIQDQIHDLEGIVKGLQSNAFDGEQLGVVREEVLGTIELEKVSQGKKNEDQELAGLRDRLLDQAKNSLLSTNN